MSNITKFLMDNYIWIIVIILLTIITIIGYLVDKNKNKKKDDTSVVNDPNMGGTIVNNVPVQQSQPVMNNVPNQPQVTQQVMGPQPVTYQPLSEQTPHVAPVNNNINQNMNNVMQNNINNSQVSSMNVNQQPANVIPQVNTNMNNMQQPINNIVKPQPVNNVSQSPMVNQYQQPVNSQPINVIPQVIPQTNNVMNNQNVNPGMQNVNMNQPQYQQPIQQVNTNMNNMQQPVNQVPNMNQANKTPNVGLNFVYGNQNNGQN